MQTHSQLPIAPFLHSQPTAVGVVELDRPLQVTVPSADPSAPKHPDALLLVRLHGQPLTFVHVGRPFGELDPGELAERVWSGAAEAILDHVARHGCPAPLCAADLERGVMTGSGSCRTSPRRAEHAVSVIVPTGDRGEQLGRCLDSLLALPREDFEIIVVDNMPGRGDTAGVVARSCRAGRRVRYLPEPRPGSSVARNRGVAESRSDIVVFVDDDVVVDCGWLDWLVSPFADPAVSATTGLVLPFELQTPAQKKFEKYCGFGRGLVRQQFDSGPPRPGHGPLYPYWGARFGTGASFAFRREDLVAVGGFDPALGGGSMALAGEDIDAMSAVILRGGSVVYEPRSVCWHQHRHSEAALRRQLFNYGIGSTALLTKALVHDRRFLVAAARSVRIVVDPRLRTRKPSTQPVPGEPLMRELARLQVRGMLRGPWRYARSVRRVRRLGLRRPIEALPQGSLSRQRA